MTKCDVIRFSTRHKMCHSQTELDILNNSFYFLTLTDLHCCGVTAFIEQSNNKLASKLRELLYFFLWSSILSFAQTHTNTHKYITTRLSFLSTGKQPVSNCLQKRIEKSYIY